MEWDLSSGVLLGLGDEPGEWGLEPKGQSARPGKLEVTLETMESHPVGFQWGRTHRKALNCLWCGGCSAEDALWWQRNDKGSICMGGMLGMDSRAIKEVALAGHGN